MMRKKVELMLLAVLVTGGAAWDKNQTGHSRRSRRRAR